MTDLLYLIQVVENARIALKKAGPHSGLHGPYAASMDEGLCRVADYLREIDDRRRERVKRQEAGG